MISETLFGVPYYGAFGAHHNDCIFRGATFAEAKLMEETLF